MSQGISVIWHTLEHHESTMTSGYSCINFNISNSESHKMLNFFQQLEVVIER